MECHSAASLTTRDVGTVTTELDALHARRKLLGKEDGLDRWRREALEAEQARAREQKQVRRLTDAEAAWQSEYLQQLVADASAANNARIASLEKPFVDALGEAFAKAAPEDPLPRRRALALRAMPVAAGIVGDGAGDGAGFSAVRASRSIGASRIGCFSQARRFVAASRKASRLQPARSQGCARPSFVTF